MKIYGRMNNTIFTIIKIAPFIFFTESVVGGELSQNCEQVCLQLTCLPRRFAEQGTVR